MAFKLEPIEIVAICLASLAVLLIIFYAIYKLTKTCGYSSSSASITPIHDNDIRERNHNYSNQDHYYNYGAGSGNNENPYMNYQSEPSITPNIQPSPSTGHTTLVTPSTSGGGSMKKYQQQHHKLKKGGMNISSPWLNSKDQQEEKDKDKDLNDELVVVTYEDGLRKLGIKPIKELNLTSNSRSDMEIDIDYDRSNLYSQQRFENKFKNVPPINTHLNYNSTFTTTATTTNTPTPSRPELIERESSRRTYHSIAGRGHGAGRRGYLHNTMNSNLLPSYYVETHAGDE